MRVARIAVRAAKCASDIGINGPEGHAGDAGVIEDRLGMRAVVIDVGLLAQHGQTRSREGAFCVDIEERGVRHGQ